MSDAFLTSSPFGRPLSGVTYGPPGSGKSTDVARALQSCVFVTTSEGTTRAYYSWLREHARDDFDRAHRDVLKHFGERSKYTAKEWREVKDAADLAALEAAGARLGLRPLLAQYVVPPGSWWTTLTALRDELHDGLDAGTLVHEPPVGEPYEINGVVLDEATLMIARVYDEMLASGQYVGRDGKVDPFAAQRAMEAWVTDWHMLSRDVRCWEWMVCQEDEPKYHEDKNKPLHYGDLKAKGGPRVPWASLRQALCYVPDICLRVTLREPKAAIGAKAKAAVADAASTKRGWIDRHYWTEAGELYEAKFRDMAISPEEKLDLPALLARAMSR